MGELTKQLSCCEWLGKERDILCPLLEHVEQWIAQHDRRPFPAAEEMLACLTHITQVPSLVIVGQDPYPDDRATGIAFQTRDNRTSSSLEYFGRELGLGQRYPNLGKWVSDHNVLLMNAALCNFGNCDAEDIYDEWKDFVISVLQSVRKLNRTSIIMLIGKTRAWPLWPDEDRVVKCGHPAYNWGPHTSDWEKVRRLLAKNGGAFDFCESPILPNRNWQKPNNL